MRVAIEQAGADRGLLVLLEGDAQRIEAEATAGRDRIEVRIHATNVTTSELPVSIIQYVVGTLESVILDDASVHNQFSADHYFSQKRCRSIFCLPLVRQTKLIGVLYLENTFGSHVFTPARASLLKLLASQAAISIENARLYADLLTAQELARKSEQRFRDFSESASDWYWETGPDHRFTTHLVSDQQLKTTSVLAALYLKSRNGLCASRSAMCWRHFSGSSSKSRAKSHRTVPIRLSGNTPMVLSC
jgi:PAS domain-containing protein